MTLRVEPIGLDLPTHRRLLHSWLEGLPRTLPRPVPAPTWQHTARRYLVGNVAYDALVTWAVVAVVASQHYSTVASTLYAVAAALGFVLTLALCRGYRSQDIAVPRAWGSIANCAGILTLVSVVLDYFAIVSVPSSIMLPTLVLTTGLVALGRVAGRSVVRRRRARGNLLRRALLVGDRPELQETLGTHEEVAARGLTVLGRCAPSNDDDGSCPSGVLGDYAAIPRLVDELSIDVVVVAAEAMTAEELRHLGWSLADRPTELFLLPPLVAVGAHRIRVEPSSTTPLLGISFHTPRSRHWAKEVIDRSLGGVLLLLALLVILPTALTIRLTSRGPAFFAQERVGLHGRPFTMHKLRSMYCDAEARLATLQQRSDGNGMLFKMHDDPRVTPIGRLIRRFSIDELPQLWNVVKGDMGLVGPRPALPREVAEYDEDTTQRLRVKPGLTGLWQVSGRSDLSAEKSVELDLEYVDNWTIGMDLHTLGRTARAVISGEGAY